MGRAHSHTVRSRSTVLIVYPVVVFTLLQGQQHDGATSISLMIVDEIPPQSV